MSYPELIQQENESKIKHITPWYIIILGFFPAYL